MIKDLELRRYIKKKKPVFVRQDAHKKSKLKKKWRRPKGLHSKMRLQKKGYRRCVKRGWGSPAAVRGLHPSGLKEVLISSVFDIGKINPKIEGGIIRAGVGLKKKIEIIKAAQEKGVKLLNVKDVDKFLENAEKDLKKRKEIKSKRIIEKEKKKKEKEAKAKEKKEDKLAEKLTEEEKKELEKKEKEKVLIKKEV